MADDVRDLLDALIRERGEDYSSISRLLGRNPAYIQQFIKRGSPRRLSEDDRRALAAYFRVPEGRLRGRPEAADEPSPALVAVPRIDIGASAGPGGIAEIEERGAPIGFDAGLLRELGVTRPAALSIIRVRGHSMEPTLRDGDDILVDRGTAAVRSGAIHVLRFEGLIVVKRLIVERRGPRPFLIRSDNPDFPDIRTFDPAETVVIGRVLWCGRRIV
jgi:phage repressor protein C with HTH and peptisase S24 domain